MEIFKGYTSLELYKKNLSKITIRSAWNINKIDSLNSCNL